MMDIILNNRGFIVVSYLIIPIILILGIKLKRDNEEFLIKKIVKH